MFFYSSTTRAITQIAHPLWQSFSARGSRFLVGSQTVPEVSAI
jgi:hypothetical protein